MENEILYGQMNFNLPHDVVELPSRGLYYKNKKSAVKVGYLNATDEDVLSSGVKNNNLLMTLLRNKLYEPEIKPEDLLDGDIEAILIFLRNTSFGPEYTINLMDPATGKMFQHTFIIDEVNFKKPNTTPNEDGTYTTTLPRTGAIVKLRLLTLGDKSKITDMETKYPKGRVAPITIWTLQEQIVELNGETDRGKIIEFVQNMPIMDSKHIKRFISQNEPGLDLTLEVIAPSGENVSTSITFGVDFFRPFFVI
jgi:hypothetical protein